MASVSLNGDVASNSNALPNYLRPSSGSCHDICKYGRRRPVEELPTKPRHKKTPKLWPSSQAKSFSPITNKHSPRPKNTSSKRDVIQVKENSSVANKMLGCHPTVKPSSPRHSSDGVCGKRRRNEDVQSRQSSMLSGDALLSSSTATSRGGKTGVVNLLPPRKRVSIESSRLPPSFQEEGEYEFIFKAVADAPSSSFHGDDGEESDKLASDTTLSQRKRGRMTRVVKPGDEHDLLVNLKFQTGKTMPQPEKSNALRWHRLGSTGVDKIRADGSVNSCVLIRPLKHRSSRIKYMRLQYGRTKILVLEDKTGDRKRNWREDDVRRNHRQHRDFEYLMEESVSKLAERRKGTVKSLVSNYETLFSHQVEQNWNLKLRKNKP